MELHIRQAAVADAPALLAYIQALASEPDIDILLEPNEIQFGVAEEEAFLAGYIESDNSTFLVAEADGRVVGTLSLDGGRFRSVRHCVALGISVARDNRNQGIGSALLAGAIAWAEKAGFIKRIELMVAVHNEPAIRLYLRHGFQFEGRKRDAVRRLGVSFDAYLMARLLP
jgi:ribosomal protein S18 acetylase RimI-like enzyme